MRNHGFNDLERLAGFEAALLFAHQLHAKQVRKGTQTPYFAHLMSVAALVLEAGGDEEETIAALLHDAVEDQGGRETLAEIENRFGGHVAAIVEGCTDAFTLPKPPWRERKEDYLAHLPTASRSVLRVSLADKLHNARTIWRDLRFAGPGVWARFTGGRDGTLWYYRQLADFFSEVMPGPQATELAEVVSAIESLAADLPPSTPAE